MELAPYVAQVSDGMGGAVALADDDTRELAARIAAAAEPAIRLALSTAVADALAEVTSALDQAGVPAAAHLLVAGNDVKIVVDAVEPTRVLPADPDDDHDGPAARITLRLPETTKAKAEAAAQTAGQSLNTYIVAAVRAATDNPGQAGRATRHRLTGWV